MRIFVVDKNNEDMKPQDYNKAELSRRFMAVFTAIDKNTELSHEVKCVMFDKLEDVYHYVLLLKQ